MPQRGVQGGLLPTGYKLITVPRLMKNPSGGHFIYYEKKLVKIGSKTRKKKATSKRKTVKKKIKRRSKKR